MDRPAPPWPGGLFELVSPLSPGCFPPAAAPAWPPVSTGGPPGPVPEARPAGPAPRQELHVTCPEREFVTGTAWREGRQQAASSRPSVKYWEEKQRHHVVAFYIASLNLPPSLLLGRQRTTAALRTQTWKPAPLLGQIIHAADCERPWLDGCSLIHNGEPFSRSRWAEYHTVDLELTTASGTY